MKEIENVLDFPRELMTCDELSVMIHEDGYEEIAIKLGISEDDVLDYFSEEWDKRFWDEWNKQFDEFKDIEAFHKQLDTEIIVKRRTHKIDKIKNNLNQ